MGNLNAIIITVVSGVLVFIVGEILKDIWLVPLQKYKEIKSKVSYALTYYAQYFSNPILPMNNSDLYKTYNDSSDEVRKISSELRGFIETLSWFKIGIPAKNKLYEASADMIGLSNSFFKHNNDNVLKYTLSYVNSIKKNLGIYTTRNK